MIVDNLFAILGTLITVLGSAAAFRYYEKRMDAKKEEELDFK